MSDTTFTQADIDSAVLEALKPLQAELDNLKASQEAETVEKRIAELKAEHETKLSELQSELDVTTAKAESAKTQYDELVAFLDNEKAEAAKLAEIATRRDERIAAVREVASYSDEYVEKAADRWASLDNEVFEALLEDIKANAPKKDGPKPNPIPAATAMVATRDYDEKDSKSALRDVMDLTLQRVPLADLR